MVKGLGRRDEEEWDRVRNLMAVVINHAGLGSRTPVTGPGLIALEKDKVFVKKAITTTEEAYELLESFI